MYIKAENKKKGFIDRKSEEVHEGEVPNSIQYLHKPQRVKSFHSCYKRTDADELERNTNLNKKIWDYKMEETEVRRIETPELEPLKIDTSSNSLVTDFEGFEPEPIYKKSGELVKPSLKYRSKSVPSTPNLSSLAQEEERESLRLPLMRSKSVHFDQATPITYFHKDESPLDIMVQNVEMLELNEDNHNELRIVDAGGQVIDDSVNNEKDLKTKMMVDASKRLRKTRMQAELVNKIKKAREEESKKSRVVERGRATFSTGEELTLGKANFATLETINGPSRLKVNIFIKLANNDPVFLEELTLKRERRGIYLIGRVLVKNFHYQKVVKIRYTWNNWVTYHDMQAQYIGTGDSILPSTNMDMFQFIIETCNLYEDAHNSLEFCIHFVSGVENDNSMREYWDNNNDKNYKVTIRY
ncbi:hypothetical protein Kpol_1070p12 [Vanderwaltozyma polyspora DSM 70294]|uniref:CBM21 domain-containing protein n=1 Tax=Vanderwaltozyma polyspora (strain ATCC 22028 / DSM 70294 / BCRC 21397 / CBS 2163 / NBRC 10782 / NRRL Y-8283 / UCD 57-17) TaxID=436907 RepID=A7TNL3_VANPO|nr:uncharacterized protein Kpol_1070p12 [Vanderwaltozyma polyspora DSM 70294]EDO16130.1 hypothetical protein Kpol_1070p12 [Vanderwaltozyma polyspora DSM 70294]